MLGPVPKVRRFTVPEAARGALVAFALAAFAAAPLAGTSCTEAGVTPTCAQNTDDAGIHKTDGGCDEFAVCQENPSNPAACCKGLLGSDLDNCLFAFGAGPSPSGGAGTTTTGGGKDGGADGGGGKDGGSKDGGGG